MAGGIECCDGLIFGAEVGILSATLTTNTEILRHEHGTNTGLQCDCAAVLRSTQQLRISSELNSDCLPLAFSTPGFTVSGTGILTSYECTFSREGFVQHNSTYEFFIGDVECQCTVAELEKAQTANCPAWGTIGSLVNGTYTYNVEVLKFEKRVGTGAAGSPLLQIAGIYSIRRRWTISATYDKDPGASSIERGAESSITLQAACGSISITKTGRVISVEQTQNKEGWSTWALTLEGYDPECSGSC
jgi:hypothetical protein